MLTHGVGPMLQYCIGAVLLDLDDPTRIYNRRIARATPFTCRRRTR